jgi:hypothetical protein
LHDYGFPFVGKVVIGFLVLVGFMALALLRLGPDRVPPEVWLARRFWYAPHQARKYVNQQTASSGKTQTEPASQPHPTPIPGRTIPAKRTNVHLVFAFLGSKWVQDAAGWAFEQLPPEINVMMAGWTKFGELLVLVKLC